MRQPWRIRRMMVVVVHGAGDDQWGSRASGRVVPGVIFVWIVAILGVIVGLGWLVEFAVARNAGSTEYVIAGAVPLTMDPAAAASLAPATTAPAGPPGTATPTGPATAKPPAGPPSVQVAASWVDSIATRTGIPSRALTGYADAQLMSNVTNPGCHLSWVMLAGIGSIESGHGSHGGAHLLPDGTTSMPILGPALDGTHGNKAIHATVEGVRLDGDVHWDHAVGPMQFLPSTWLKWGVSATGGTPNPEDIDDAALTAANYLCAHNRDLSTVDGWRAGLAAYNAPDAYAVKVTNAANKYAKASLG
jgi:membrane-bound lytic murein transglycosylase B